MSPLPTPDATRPGLVLPTPTSTGPEAYLDASALRVLRADGRFETFVGIIEQGRIGRSLELWSNPHHDATIFAPTDDAFRSLDPVLLEAAMDDRILPRVVTNHVLIDPRRLGDLEDGEELQTLGVKVAVRRAGGTVTVAGVPVVDGDVEAGVTVIHVLDQLILPCNDAYLRDMLGPRYARHCRS